MIVNIENAGFRVDFTPIFWTYASGFPKASNISKLVDKKFGADREITGAGKAGAGFNNVKGFGVNTIKGEDKSSSTWDEHNTPSTPQAISLDGSYGGFQPKPAVEVVIVAMKPLGKNTYIDQALDNEHGITWLNDCRIPTSETIPNTVSSPTAMGQNSGWNGHKNRPVEYQQHDKGRFPANLLISDGVLDDGIKRSKGDSSITKVSGYSKFFSLDNWWECYSDNLPAEVKKTLPFLIVPKASKSEKDRGLEGVPAGTPDKKGNGLSRVCSECGARQLETDPNKKCQCVEREGWIQQEAFPKQQLDTRSDASKGSMTSKGLQPGRNFHPTVKPLKLMSYLITLGSRPGQVVLDPYSGSGTTGVASVLGGRDFIGMELSQEYARIIKARLEHALEE
jgi:site-specific DNA-methyltransferase (adenine-specific)